MEKTILLAVYAGASTVLIVLAVPLIAQRVGPNRWYGFRTPRTLADRHVWFAANRLAGRHLAAAGFTMLVGAIAFYFVPQWHVQHYTVANLVVTLFAVGYAMLQSFRGLSRIRSPEEKHPFPASSSLETPARNRRDDTAHDNDRPR
jgi:uncharacterized membrane protein